jgi:hypothetical protein
MSTAPVRDPQRLRSRTWFDSLEYYSFARRAYLRSEGLTRARRSIHEADDDAVPQSHGHGR